MTPPPPVRPVFSRYGFAVLTTVTIVSIHSVLHYFTGNIPPLLLFTLAVVFTAWWGGFGPGLLATVLCLVALETLIPPPARGTYLGDSEHLIRIGTFVVINVAISAIAHALHSAVHREWQKAEALSASEERLRLAAEATEDVIWDWDIASGRVQWSVAMEKRFGWPEALPSTDEAWWQERIHDEDRERTLTGIRAVLADRTHDRWEGDYRFRRGDGTYARVLDRGCVQRDATGRAVRMIGATLDLTASEETTAAARRNRKELQAIIDTVPSLISYVDREFIYRWNNRAYERWFQRPLAQITGRPMRELLGEAAFALVRPQIERALGDVPHEYEDYLPYADRDGRWIHAVYEPHHAADGSVDGVVVAVTDITERKLAEAAVREAAEQRRLALEAADLGAWDYRFQTGEILGDERFFRMFGVIADKFTYAAAFERIHPDDRADTHAAVDAALAGVNDGKYRKEYRVIWPDGTLRWLAVHGRAYFTGTEGARRPLRFTGICIDITDRVLASERLAAALEAAEAANRAKDAFLGTLSHELRTPLTPVLFLAATLARSPDLSPALREDFAMIRRNIELEARLIDDLLDVTRITSGKLQLDLQPTDLHTVLERSITLLRRDIDARHLVLETDLAAAPHEASADPLRVQQVFWNVLKNAVKFTPEGGTITVRSRCEESGRWHLAISDTGLGITAEELPSIFDAFAQGKEASSHRFGGLGLGLAICDRVVREHGGRIWAESAGRDLGSTFHIEIPRDSTPAAREAVAAPAPPLPAPPSRRLLIVEDHEPTRQALDRLLKELGYEVTIAATAERARQLAAASTYDLMVSDLGLPDGSGHDLVVEFGRDYGLKAIALSGYGTEADVLRSKTAGFLDHLTKPVDIEAVHAAILRALNPG